MVVENMIMLDWLFFLEETVSLVHLFGWKAISQSASHRAAESRSCWSLRQSPCVLISLQKVLIYCVIGILESNLCK